MIFTEQYNVSDRYSLTTQEKVSTIEMMPARFTILKSFDYGPNLDAGSVTALQKYFSYMQKNTTDPNYEFDNNLYVYHLDDVIQKLFCRKFYKYETISHPRTWQLFIEGIDQPEFHKFKQRIDALTDITDAPHTSIVGASFNVDGTIDGLRIHDSTYNLAEYSNNDYLSRINEVAVVRNDVCKGTVQLYNDSDVVTYRLAFSHPEHFTQNYNDKGLVRCTDQRGALTREYLDLLSRDGGVEVITKDQVTFIESLLTGESYCTYEFDIDADGTLKEVFVEIARTESFVDLSSLTPG